MSHPFSPTQIRFGGHGNDDKNGVWVRLWLGPQGSPSVISSVADLNSGSPDLWRSLGRRGVLVSYADRKKIIDKIPSTPGPYMFKVVSSLGWHLGYVTPTKVFGAPPVIVERQFGDLDLSKYRSCGTLREWQQFVLPLCSGNSRLMFAVLCAFAGPLLKILGIGSFGFHLFGPSSIGKTITLIIAGSVLGCRVGASAHQGFCDKWATTLEGVQRFGRTHNDGFGIIDDTRLGGTDRDVAKLIAPFIMRLAEGVAKNRAVAIDAGGDWRLVYLGSSNLSLVEMFSAAGLAFDDAYRVRFPDIPADAGCGYGVFEDIHGYPNAAKFANELRNRALRDFGTASEHYLTQLTKDRRERPNWLVERLHKATAYYRTLAPAGSAADGRITDLFAVVYAAGLLARHYGILPWTPQELTWAVRTCELAHRQFAAGAQVTLDPIAAVRAYIVDHLPRFRRVPDQSITAAEFPKVPGFIYTDQRGVTEYLISQPVFGRQFAHLNRRRVLQALDRAALLVRMGNKYVDKAPTPISATVGRKYVYRLRGSILAKANKE